MADWIDKLGPPRDDDPTSQTWWPPVETIDQLPKKPSDGQARLVISENQIYVSRGGHWRLVRGA